MTLHRGGEEGTYVKHIDPGLVDKEAFKQALNDDETLAEDEDGRVDDGAGPAVEDDEKGQLGEEGKGEEEKVDEQGDYRQGEDAADKERVEVGTAEEIPYPVEGVRRGSEGAREVVGRSAKRMQHDLTRQGAHRLRVWHDGLSWAEDG